GPTSLVTLLNGLLYLQLGRRYRAQMLRSALVLVAALSLVLTFSRGSIFSCVLSGVVYVATGTKRVRGMAMVIVLAGCIAAALLVGSSSEVIDLRAGERLQNLTTESRMDLMSGLFSDYVLPNPTIGMGFFPKG